MKLARILSYLGALTTLGFGIWHFLVPSIFQWFSYIPEAPNELKIGFSATNFFLSLELTILGLMGLVFISRFWDNIPVVSVYLAFMSLLWFIRFVYQLVTPQGSGLPIFWQTIIYGSFLLTAIYFIAPILLILSNKKNI